MCQHPNVKEGHTFYSPSFRQLIQGMLSPTPRFRPTLSDVLAHPWVEGITATPQGNFDDFSRRQELLKINKEEALQVKNARIEESKRQNELNRASEPETIDQPLK